MSRLFFKRPTRTTTPTTNTTATYASIAREDEVRSAVNQPTNSAVMSGPSSIEGIDAVHVLSGDAISNDETSRTVLDTVVRRASGGETDHENKVARQGESVVLTPSPLRAPLSTQSSSELLFRTSAGLGPCKSIHSACSLPISQFLKGVENKSRGDQIAINTARKERLQELFRVGHRALVLASGMPPRPPRNNNEEAVLPKLDADKGAVVRGALALEPKRQRHNSITVASLVQSFDQSNNNGLSSSSTVSSSAFNQHQHLPKDQNQNEDNKRQQESRDGDAHPSGESNDTPTCVVDDEDDDDDDDDDDISDYMTMVRANRLGNVNMSNNNSSGSSQLVLSPSPPTSVVRENPQMTSNDEVDAAGSENMKTRSTRDSIVLPLRENDTNNCPYRHVPFKRSLLDALLQPDGRHSSKSPSNVGFDNGGVMRECGNRRSEKVVVEKVGAQSVGSYGDATRSNTAGSYGHGKKSLLEQIAFRQSLSEGEDGDDDVNEKSLQLAFNGAHPLANESPMMMNVAEDACSPMHVRRSLSLQPPVEYPPPPHPLLSSLPSLPHAGSNLSSGSAPVPLCRSSAQSSPSPSTRGTHTLASRVVEVNNGYDKGSPVVGMPITRIDLSDDESSDDDESSGKERLGKESAHASWHGEREVAMKTRGAVSLSLSPSPLHGVTTARHGTAVCAEQQQQQLSEILRLANLSGERVKGEDSYPPAARRLIDLFSPPHTHVQSHTDTSCTAKKDYDRPLRDINFDDI